MESFFVLVVLLVIGTSLCVADRSQADCQDNEVFVTCGHCEGTCSKPIVPDCEKRCRGERCECQASRGFVRSKHGHCIRKEECPGPSIYSQDPYKGLRKDAHVISSGDNTGHYSDTIGRGKESLVPGQGDLMNAVGSEGLRGQSIDLNGALEHQAFLDA